jgi:hypothetical protein
MVACLTIVVDDPTQLDQEPHPESAPEPAPDLEHDLDLLGSQTIKDAVLIAIGSAASTGAVASLARSKGWMYGEADSLEEAVARTATEFIVGWAGVRWADASVLEDLVTNAKQHPGLAGALSANFDPMILWRTEALDNSKKFEPGLAVAAGRADGGTSRLHPGVFRPPDQHRAD